MGVFRMSNDSNLDLSSLEENSSNSGLHIAILVGITALVFFFLFRQIDIVNVVFLLKNISCVHWVLASTLTLSFFVIIAVRWRIVLLSMGFHISLRESCVIILGVWPISTISPSKSGDLLRAISLRKKIKPMVVAGSVLTERMLDFLMIAVFALMGGLLFRRFDIISIASAVIFCVVVSVWITGKNIRIPFGQKAGVQLENLLQSIRMLRKQPVLLTAIVLLTILKWVAVFAQAAILFRGVGATVPFGFIMAALPISILAGLLPITLGGMGVRESAMVVLFHGVATESQSLAVGLLYSFFGYWLLAILGIPFIKKALT